MQFQSSGPDLPARYQDALGDRDPIASQREAPFRIARMVAEYDESVLSLKPEPSRWSVKEIVAHLADGEVIVGARLRFVAAHDRPPLPGYDQDAFVARLGVDRTTTEALLRAFTSSRGVNLDLLARLPPEAGARVGLHAERGEESIDFIVALYAAHDLVHEEQIARTLSAVTGNC